MQSKQDEMEEIHDMLDSWDDHKARRILGKLTYVDLIELASAIRKYGKDEVEKAIQDMELNNTSIT